MFELILSGTMFSGACGGKESGARGEVIETQGPPPPTSNGLEDSGTDGEEEGFGGIKFDLGSSDEEETGGEGGSLGELPAIPDSCEDAQGQSNVGCLFFGVDLNQADEADYETLPYAIAISNVQVRKTAKIRIEQKMGADWQLVGEELAVRPLDLQFAILEDLHQEDSGVFLGGAYRVISDVPVIAYQFSPVDGENSFSSDASLLLPVSSWDSVYQMVGYEVSVSNGLNGATWTSYLTIVASKDGTIVEVTPSTNTDASLPEHMNGPVIPAGTAGVPFTVELNEGDIANVSVAELGENLSGTLVVSDEEHPISMFSGTECSFIPADQYACDHLEEQLAGVQQWGKHFVASRVPVRAGAEFPVEQSLWQVAASENDTTVEFVVGDGVTGITAQTITMQAGELREYYVAGTHDAPGDFEVIADKPIAVVNYMVGELNVEGGGGGDPAMVQISPVDQYLDRYVVMVPLSWINDIAVLTRKAGAPIKLDGVLIDDSLFQPVGGGKYEVARIPVEDGVHTFEATSGDVDTGKKTPFSVIVVGYDSFDSYAYLGGTGTGIINPIQID